MMRAGGMPPKPMKPIEFVVDHPFMYFIRDNRSGAILFVGVVNDPSKE
jgi:serpin B